MIFRELNYNNYNFKLVGSNEPTQYNYYDMQLQVYKDNILLKVYKVKHSFEYFYKILKTQVNSSDIYQLFDTVNNDTYISNIFFNKLIEVNRYE